MFVTTLRYIRRARTDLFARRLVREDGLALEKLKNYRPSEKEPFMNDRQRKLISKIDAALQRIEDNTYGYCEETGEPISLKRLEARPIATLSVEAQERHEKREKVYRDE